MSSFESTTKNIRICLIGAAGKCSKTIKSAEGFNVPVLYSETGLECMNEPEWKTYFVLEDFYGELFDTITKNKER